MKKLKVFLTLLAGTLLAAWLTANFLQVVKAHSSNNRSEHSSDISLVKPNQTSNNTANTNNSFLLAQLNADNICSRPGVNNLCNIPELGRNCSSNTDWELGYYDYGDLCGARVCGNPAPTQTTLMNAVGPHPADARHDPDYNVEVRGFYQTNDAANFTAYGGMALS